MEGIVRPLCEKKLITDFLSVTALLSFFVGLFTSSASWCKRPVVASFTWHSHGCRSVGINFVRASCVPEI